MAVWCICQQQDLFLKKRMLFRLRVCSRAFKTTPVVVLQMGEMLLYIRRMPLIANYWANLQGHNDGHSTKRVIKVCWEYGKCKKVHFGRIGNEIVQVIGLQDMTISLIVVYAMAPWNMICSEVDWKLLKIKQEANIDLVDAFNIHIMEKYKDMLVMQIYTDGTKKTETGVTGFGVVIPKKRKK